MPQPQNNRNSEPEIIDIEKKDGLLEELNLPPKVIKFIRNNSTNIQIVGAVLIVLILAWSYYDYHTQTRQSKAALALSSAVQQKDNVVRLESLTSVARDYSGTGAALWSILEEGHLAFKESRYEDALGSYRLVYEDISGSSPLRPLVTYSMALACENSGQLDQALTYFRELAGNNGFSTLSLTSQGRILELQGNRQEALQAYRQVVTDKNLPSQERSLIEEKINNLQAAVTG